jgi:large subunit ribosomal protein L20
MAKGFVGARSKLYETARELVERSLPMPTATGSRKSVSCASVDHTLNAAARENGLSYSVFMRGLNLARRVP